jgi:hypothetical protein
LSIAANIKTYEVGAATATSIANNEYIQSLSTVTFTFGDASTNDLTAALEIQGTPTAVLNDGTSNIANGALTVNSETKVVTATFTSVTLDPSKTYTITLPANAIAWDKNTTNKNSEKVITFKTPDLFDGTYFIATTDGTQFISRGGDSNTEAVLDEFGIAVNFSTDANNVTMLQLIDNERYIFGGSKTIYTDRVASDDNVINYGKWTVATVAGGYSLYNTGRSKYIAAGTGEESKVEAATYADAAYTWKLVAPATHAAIMATYKDANAAAVAAAAGLSASTVSDLKTALATFNSTSITPTNTYSSITEKYQPSGYTEKIIEQEYSDLENGIYKVTLSAFHRIKDNAATYACYQNNTDNPTSYLYANDQRIQLPSVMSEYSNEAYTGGENPGPNYSVDGKNYPNNLTATGSAFTAGRYQVEVFVMVTDGTLKIGLNDPGKYTDANWAYSNWICFRDLSITRYQPKNESVTISAVDLATFASDYDLDFSTLTSTLKAYKATVSGKAITFTAVTEVPAGEGVLLKSVADLDANTVFNIPVTTGVSAWAADANAFVRGTGVAVATGTGPYNYVLSTKSGVPGFYQAAGQIIPSNKAYLQSTTNAARIAFNFDDETTGIKTIDNGVQNTINDVYNLKGQRVSAPTKGLYIMNGKKVMFK